MAGATVEWARESKFIAALANVMFEHRDGRVPRDPQGIADTVRDWCDLHGLTDPSDIEACTLVVETYVANIVPLIAETEVDTTPRAAGAVR